MAKKLIPSTLMAALLVALAPVAAQAGKTWDGLYLGVTAGTIVNDEGAKEKSAYWDDYSCCTGTRADTFQFGTNADNILASVAQSQAFKTDGAIYGANLGYNRQFGSIVLGGEFEYSGSNSKGQNGSVNGIEFSSGLEGYTTTVSASEIDALFTARLRAGFVVTPSLLLYVTGGAAMADVKASLSIDGEYDHWNGSGSFGNVESRSATKAGWVAGAGAEYKVADNWSIKGEWLHYDVGSVSVTNTVYDDPYNSDDYVTKTNSFDFKGDTFRLGVNYLF